MTEETKEKSTTRKIEEELEVLVQISSEMQKQLDKGECKLPGFKEATDYFESSHSLKITELYKSHRNVGTGEGIMSAVSAGKGEKRGDKKGSSPVSSPIIPFVPLYHPPFICNNKIGGFSDD